MRFSSVVLLNPTAALLDSDDFTANSIFDPKPGDSTHQPYGRDTLNTVYNNYKVLSSKCTADFVSQAVGGPGLYVAGVTLSSAGGALLGSNSFQRERPETSWKMVGNLESGKPIVKIKKNYSSARFFGNTRGAQVQADMAAPPAERAFFHVWVTSVDGLTDPSSIPVTVTITYKVLCSDPVNLTQS